MPWRRFVAFGVVAACAEAVYSVAASVYMPGIFETYVARYGVVGVVFALISLLSGAMVVIVASSALGREVHEEIGRLRHGERPSEDEVRKQWNEVLARRAAAGPTHASGPDAIVICALHIVFFV